MLKSLAFSLGLLAFAASASAQDVEAFKKMAVPSVGGLVHLEGYGDRELQSGVWAGTKGESRRLEGLALKLSDTHGALRIEYLCHLQDVGDVGPVIEGAFCGTRGQSRRLEAVQIRLTGPAAQFFMVKYECHLQDIGDTGPVADFATCGTRGQSRRLEAIRVWIERR